MKAMNCGELNIMGMVTRIIAEGTLRDILWKSCNAMVQLQRLVIGNGPMQTVGSYAADNGGINPSTYGYSSQVHGSSIKLAMSRYPFKFQGPVNTTSDCIIP